MIPAMEVRNQPSENGKDLQSESKHELGASFPPSDSIVWELTGKLQQNMTISSMFVPHG